MQRPDFSIMYQSEERYYQQNSTRFNRQEGATSEQYEEDGSPITDG